MKRKKQTKIPMYPKKVKKHKINLKNNLNFLQIQKNTKNILKRKKTI